MQCQRFDSADERQAKFVSFCKNLKYSDGTKDKKNNGNNVEASSIVKTAIGQIPKRKNPTMTLIIV
eukprot:10791264-Ditylum_brightwellii.AAC.1